MPGVSAMTTDKLRCEVCHRVIAAKTATGRRRCVKHVTQLVLVPVSALRRGRGSGGQK